MYLQLEIRNFKIFPKNSLIESSQENALKFYQTHFQNENLITINARLIQQRKKKRKFFQLLRINKLWESSLASSIHTEKISINLYNCMSRRLHASEKVLKGNISIFCVSLWLDAVSHELIVFSFDFVRLSILHEKNWKIYANICFIHNFSSIKH